MTKRRSIEPRSSFLAQAITIAGAAVSLAACVVSPARTVTGTSAPGQMTAPGGDMVPAPPVIIADGGVALPVPGVDGGSTCVNGQAVAPAGIRGGGGPQPVIPSTVTQAQTPVPPIAGGTLLVLADGATAVASDPDRDTVYVVDLAKPAVRAIALQAGDEPGRVIQDAAGRVHVALRRGGAIATIDTATATVSARRVVCSAPRGLAYEASTQLLQVACAGGELVSLPAAGGAASRSITLERDLRDIVTGPNGTLLVSTFRKAEVLVVAANGTISSRLAPGSGMVPTIIGPPQMRTPSVAWRMVSYGGDTTGKVVMLHQTGVTDTVDPAAGGYAGLKGCGGIVQAGVSVLAPGSGSPPVASGVNNVSLAVDVAVSPDQSKTAIAVPGNGAIPGFPTIVEGSTATMAQTGGIPCGVGGESLTNPQPPGQVVAVAYSSSGVLFAQTREPAALWREDTGVTVGLATDSRDDTGHDIFHVNAGGGLACASCHPEGGEDGRVWNFVCVGARRTQSIRGGISPTAPFHWDGAEHDFSHLMDDVFSGRMAGPMLSEVQKTALATWVDTIPAMPATAGLDAGAVARGKALFNDTNVACASCHAGALLTNNTTVDVGTGSPLQVPSLRGVSWRAPFMHNGCAATLTDRFSATTTACTGGDKHGMTLSLTSAQIGDLTTYLQSL